MARIWTNEPRLPPRVVSLRDYRRRRNLVERAASPRRARRASRGSWTLALALAATLSLPLLGEGARGPIDFDAASILTMLPPWTPASGEACAIVRVVDGDTLRVRCPGGAETDVRLIGFDAPEAFSPACAAEKARADAATRALWSMVEAAERVSFAFDGRDAHDRRLAVLRLDGRNVAEAMIAGGHARPAHGGPRAGWCGPG